MVIQNGSMVFKSLDDSGTMDFTSEAFSGYYNFTANSDASASTQNGIAANNSDTLYTVEIPIKAGDRIVNNSQIAWSTAASMGLMTKTGLIRVRQLVPTGTQGITETAYRKFANINDYTVTAQDIADGADTFICVYRTTSQSETFSCVRIRP